ncbi:helix-turn-helix domain-containing protein [Buttiauxella sp. B2]|uniref:helix-turn-helix domain-containing protein n=1 Tax=Buttiauxella sp. B2 TaxID=2587812 RepID=UPI001673BB31|nr:helix-turn-helix domain-containing protein [Buttiauxella sp. B2]
MKKMTVKAIVEWIEDNVSSGISIDDIVKVSGYSRRYIEKIFKEHVGMPLGKYIRHRRLSMAAIRLRLTSQSATDIAHHLNFDSQQSFSREFKKLFNLSPREYRKKECWDLANLKSPFNFESTSLPVINLVELQEMEIVGHELNYSESIIDKPINSNPLRMDAIVTNLNYYKEDIYLLSSFEPTGKAGNSLNIMTFIGIKAQKNKKYGTAKSQRLAAGLYAGFNFRGRWEDYESLSRRTYMETLSKCHLKRRKGTDVEHFRFVADISTEEDFLFESEYYIPVTH